MKVTELWRYPVKTMAGERLQRVGIGPLGIVGNRVVHVEDAGQVITSRSHPRFLGHKGTLGAQRDVMVDGRPWDGQRRLPPMLWTSPGLARSWCAAWQRALRRAAIGEP